MKKIYSIVLVALATLMFSSCVKDFLDIQPRGKEVPAKIDHYEGMLSHTTFSSLQTLSYPHQGEELCGDANTMNRLLSVEKDCGLNAFKYDKAVYTDNLASNEWNKCYSAIYTYNFVADNVMDSEGGTEQHKKELRAEARMRRAYSLFTASLFFSPAYNEATAATDLSIPIVTKADVTASGLTRNTVKEVYDFIIKEMTESVNDLPDKYNVLRVYSAAGWYMLGRVYWYKGDYANALAALRTSLEKANSINGVGLLNFRSMSVNAKGYYASFVAPEKSSETLSTMYYTASSLTSATGIPYHYLKPEYAAKYVAGDLRKNLITEYTAGTGLYRPVTRAYTNLGGELPELYMMLAECEARVGSFDNAVTLMEDYRKTRFADDASAAVPAEAKADKNSLVKFILMERVLEYPAHGASVIDMKRLWNDPVVADRKAQMTHPIYEAGAVTETFSLADISDLTWKIPSTVMSFHSDWQNN